VPLGVRGCLRAALEDRAAVKLKLRRRRRATAIDEDLRAAIVCG
jgi:hypothetical protein